MSIKVTYKFATGEMTEVEVSEEIGTVILDSRREEESAERRHRRHCYSLDAITYEGNEYGTADFTDALCDDGEEGRRVREAFSHLSETQQRRLLMLASGLSLREIARREGKRLNAIQESIEGARKKFLKFF